jgi:DNA (cytosine-5)-methyltransferase 1
MKVGSLFSGIGGLDLAIEAHGYQVAWQVENDDYCNKVLAKHWPEVTRYGDIRTAQFDEFARVDGIVGGFPCQPFSVAGRNRGEDDERNMWPEVIRAIRALQPGFAFLENVPGLLNHGYFGRILGDLAEAGYDAEWTTLRASDIGAPHRRERLFILAYAQHDGHCNSGAKIQPDEARVDALSDVAAHGRNDVADAGHPGQPRRISDEGGSEGLPRSQPSSQSSAMADTKSIREREQDDAQRAESRGNSRLPPGRIQWHLDRFPPPPNDRDGWARLLSEMPEAQPAICRDAARLSDRMDNRAKRLKALGNAVVWPQAALAFQELNRRIINGGGTDHGN